jgi:hypothetical protein
MATHPGPQYSGGQSQKFWNRVNATGDQTLYLMGCLLQDTEARVLQALKEAECRKRERN